MQQTHTENDPLLFIHLPKTAGGSVKELVEDSFEPPDLYLFYHDDYARAAAEAKEARLVYGHFIYGFHEMLGCQPRYCCFLRNPIERVISHYYHLVNVDESEHGDLARSYRSVGDFVANSGYWARRNMMCRIITGIGDQRVPPVDDLYELARQTLRDHFPVFGIAEMLPLSLEVMRRSIGLSIGAVPVVNKGDYRLPGLTRADIDRVVEENQADLRLYSWAVQRFLNVVVPQAFEGPPLPAAEDECRDAAATPRPDPIEELSESIRD